MIDPREDGPDLSVTHGAISLNDVSFSYEDSNTPVLRDLTGTIPGQSLTVITGSSGAGKTTLLRLLLGLDMPATGTVSIDGQDINKARFATIQQAIALVPQEPVLFSGSMAENLLLGLEDTSDAEVLDACARAGLIETVQELPNGLDTEVGSGKHLLSGGQMRRLAIARALLRKPAVLLLDEPTTGLDEQNSLLVLDTLRRISDRTTVVMVSHRSEPLRASDHHLILKDGGWRTSPPIVSANQLLNLDNTKLPAHTNGSGDHAFVNAAQSNGADSNGAQSNGAQSNGSGGQAFVNAAQSNGADSNGAQSNGSGGQAFVNGAQSNGSQSNGAQSNGSHVGIHASSRGAFAANISNGANNHGGETNGAETNGHNTHINGTHADASYLREAKSSAAHGAQSNGAQSNGSQSNGHVPRTINLTADTAPKSFAHTPLGPHELARSACDQPILLTGLDSPAAKTRGLLLSGHRSGLRPAEDIIPAVLTKLANDHTQSVALAAIENVNPDGRFSSRHHNLDGHQIDADHRELAATETQTIHQTIDSWKANLVIDLAQNVGPSEGPNQVHVVVRFRPNADQQPSCLLYTSPSPRDATLSRMPSSA